MIAVQFGVLILCELRRAQIRKQPAEILARAPRPRALAQSPSFAKHQKLGEGGVSGACAPRRQPMVRTRRAARPGAARTFERAQMPGRGNGRSNWRSEGRSNWKERIDGAKRNGGRTGAFL